MDLQGLIRHTQRVTNAEKQRNEAWKEIQNMQHELKHLRLQQTTFRQNAENTLKKVIDDYENRIKEMSLTMTEWYEMVSGSYPSQFTRFQNQLRENDKLIKENGVTKIETSNKDYLLIVDDDTDDENDKTEDSSRQKSSEGRIKCPVCLERKSVDFIGFRIGIDDSSEKPTCGHIICGTCGPQVNTGECPICRKHIKYYERVYFN